MRTLPLFLSSSPNSCSCSAAAVFVIVIERRAGLRRGEYEHEYEHEYEQGCVDLHDLASWVNEMVS
jgi:hypothetical protein